MSYKDQVVLITGGASGIGKASVIEFAKEGAKVVFADIQKEKGTKLKDDLIKKKYHVDFYHLDISELNSVDSLLNYIVDEYGCLDIAFNNAGVQGQMIPTIQTTIDNWDKVLSVNARSVFYCMKKQLEIMCSQKKGVILNNASAAGLRGLPNGVAYSASKHAVVGMTKTAAMEYAKFGIRINALCPSFTETEMFSPELFDKISEGISEKLRKKIPMKRFAKVEEQVGAVMWLCSEKASYVTGQAFAIDGGLTA